ncbi:hypothetical protein ACFLXC_03205 [Chloroflexota bacterium]
MLGKEMEKLPDSAKEALAKTEVDIIRRPDSLEIAIDSKGDEDVEKVKGVILDSLQAPIAQIVTLFGCRANISS